MKKIELVPDKDYSTHRINENTMALYISNDNINYTLIPKTNWEYQKDDKGVITLTLKERLATRYLKLHVKYDERGWDFKPVNKATFLNEVAQMLRVYQEADSRTEEYQYDMAGNRKLLRVTLARTLDFKSEYYTNTDRLKTDGKYAFVYDKAGNMVKKGNTFTISGDTVNFTETSGEGVEYWEYRYDLLNRLVEVIKNGSKVAEYEYDPEGFRVVAKKYLNDTTLKEKRHYIFQGTEPLFEKNITTGKMKSFVYALGKHLARVDGTIGDTQAKKYWYVTDHLGSVRAVTDVNGKKVWSADYLAFGTQYGKDSDTDFEELHSFTGKEYDPDTGLHYYCARWYDSELGRFISEDPAGDPNNPNLYSYTGNNPLTRIDPTGEGWVSDTWSAITSFFSSLFGGENSNTGSIGGRPDVTPPPGSSSSESESDENDDIEGKKENVYVVDYDVQKQIQMDRRQLLDKVKEELDKAENAELGSEEWSQAMDNMAKYFEEIGILNGKEEYNMAAINLESARKTRRANPGKWKDAKEWYNQALDNLLDLAGYDQYNHKNFYYKRGRYIHVNSNPDVVITIAELGDKLGAASVKITEGDRTEWEHYNVVYKDYEEKGKVPPNYKDKNGNIINQHGRNMAVDVTFYNAGGQPISPQTAYNEAYNMPEIGGVAIYKGLTIVHIDLRTRKSDGTPSTW